MPVYQVYPKKRNSFFNNLSVNSNLILINIICFIVFMIMIYINAKFLDYIAIKPANILQGKYLWTFLTSMFMHGGFFHLYYRVWFFQAILTPMLSELLELCLD